MRRFRGHTKGELVWLRGGRGEEEREEGNKKIYHDFGTCSVGGKMSVM